MLDGKFCRVMEAYGFELVVKCVQKGHQLSGEFSDDIQTLVKYQQARNGT